MAEDLKDLLAQAVAELGITVPVMRAEASGTGLKLWLYGGDGKPVTWRPKAPAQAKPRARSASKRRTAKKNE